MMINKPCFSFENNTKKWKPVPLGHVLKINSGRDYKHLNAGEIPVYGTGGYMLSVDQSLSKENAIGIGRKGTIDKPQLLYAPFWTVDTLFFMTPQKNNDLYFLYSYMQKINWKSYDESSGVPSLSKLNIEKIDMLLPNGEEQIQIGSFFKDLDDLISLHQQELDVFKQTKQGFLQKMFLNEGESSPKLRFSGFTGDWVQRRLGEISNIVTGSTPSTTNKEYYCGDFLFVSPADIQGNRYVEATKTTLSKNGFDEGRKVKCGSTLFVSIGSTIGKVAQASKEVITNQQINSVIPNIGMDENFVFSLLEKNSKIIKNLSATQAVPIINKNTFLNINVMIPTLEEQVKIGEFFRQLDEVIELKEQELKALKKTKQGFLQKMFV